SARFTGLGFLGRSFRAGLAAAKEEGPVVKKQTGWIVALALLGAVVPAARSQQLPTAAGGSIAPAAPAVPGAGLTTAVAPLPGAAPAAPARNIFSFLCPTPEQKAACLDKLCN